MIDGIGEYFAGVLATIVLFAFAIGSALAGLVWLCVWWLTPTPAAPEPVIKRVYVQHCRGCDNEWNCDEPPEGPIRTCPLCPLNVCEKGVGYLLTFGTIQGIAKAQPENAEAQEKWRKLEAEMMAHFEECEQCREAFGGRL